MAMAQLLTLTHGVDDKVTRIDDEVQGVMLKWKILVIRSRRYTKVRNTLNYRTQPFIRSMRLDGKETKAIVQRIANNVSEVMGA